MPTRPDPFPSLAAEQAESVEVAMLFRQLSDRAIRLAELQEIASEMVVKHREARKGKPFKFTKAQTRVLSELEKDAVKANGTDDSHGGRCWAALLSST